MDRIDKINRLLAEKGWTGADLSRAIGVSSGTYSQWNTRLTKPSRPKLRLIAEALGVPVESLLSDDELPPETKKAPVPEDEGLQEYLELMSQMTTEQLQKWLLLGKMIVEGKL